MELQWAAWRGRSEVNQIREQDTDWRRVASHQPCSSVRSARLLRVSPVPRVFQRHSGPMDDARRRYGSLPAGRDFPVSVVAQGGIYRWRTAAKIPTPFRRCSDTPGFLVSYSTSFGNDSDSFTRVMGDRATLVNIGGEGSQRWKIVEEHGTTRAILRPRAHEYIKLAGRNGRRWDSPSGS